jgi:hypothetical protein
MATRGYSLKGTGRGQGQVRPHPFPSPGPLTTERHTKTSRVLPQRDRSGVCFQSMAARSGPGKRWVTSAVSRHARR